LHYDNRDRPPSTPGPRPPRVGRLSPRGLRGLLAWEAALAAVLGIVLGGVYRIA